MLTKIKVIAYFIRQRNNQMEVLVFDHHQMPEAGTQVVGGTVEPNEDLGQAIVREIWEEAGQLVNVSQLKYLAETQYQRKDREELNLRTYFYLDGNHLPDTWSHKVISDGEDNGLQFNFYWLTLAAAKQQLTGNFAECLHLIHS